MLNKFQNYAYESCDLWIIDFYHNESALLIFVVINLTLSVLNIIHVFIWYKWNKIIWIETTKKRKIFFPWKIIFLYPIDLDVYYDKSMYTILNLLKVMLIFWWFWWFKFEMSFIKIMILISWNNMRLPLMIILIHGILDSWLGLTFVYEMVEIFVRLNSSLLLSIYACYMLKI